MIADRISHLQQPQSMRTCGQHCLAMLANISVTDACSVVGHRRGLDYGDMRDALSKLGFHFNYCFELGDAPDSGVFLCKLRKARRRNWHWIIKVDGIFFDPACEAEGMRIVGEITAHLEIRAAE